MMIYPTWKETMRIPESALRELSLRLGEKRRDIVQRKSRADSIHHQYAPLLLPFQKTIRDMAERLVDVVGEPQLLILIGIGGSSLGTEAIVDALGLRRRVMVFDTLVPERLTLLEERLVEERLERGDILVVTISKSGETTETDANTTAVLTILEAKYGDIRDRVIAISGEGTPLDARARENGWKFFGIPKAVGGRYSVFSAVGLIPLRLLGVDIDALLRGAQEYLEGAWKSPIFSDPGSVLAALTYVMHEKGVHREIDFYFDPRLETLGKWQRQLIAESTGKRLGSKRVGVLPEVALGSTDLHSIEQYVIDGPRDLFLVIHSVTLRRDVAPSVYHGKTLAELREIVVRGLQMSYRDAGVLHCHLSFGEVNEKTLGAFMAMRMESTILLAHLLSVDPFDQPGVESYKTHTRALLGKKREEV